VDKPVFQRAIPSDLPGFPGAFEDTDFAGDFILTRASEAGKKDRHAKIFLRGCLSPGKSGASATSGKPCLFSALIRVIGLF
jgi:hypothetical protein